MSKVKRESVAIVIKDEDGRFLAVKRADDDSFPGMWSLPAATVRDGESLEDAAKRAAKDKLGVDIKMVGEIGDASKDAHDCVKHMTEFEVEIVGGAKPTLEVRDPTVSRYSEMKYCDEPSLLIPATKSGALCSGIYLRSLGVEW